MEKCDMPHIVLEYTEPLEHQIDPAALLRKLHEALGATQGFELDRIKSRAVSVGQFLVGREKPAAFVHATVVFSQGRPPELREDVGRSLLALLTAETQAHGSEHRTLCSVEVRHFEPGAYFTSQARTRDQSRDPMKATDSVL